MLLSHTSRWEVYIGIGSPESAHCFGKFYDFLIYALTPVFVSYKSGTKLKLDSQLEQIANSICYLKQSRTSAANCHWLANANSLVLLDYRHAVRLVSSKSFKRTSRSVRFRLVWGWLNHGQWEVVLEPWHLIESCKTENLFILVYACFSCTSFDFRLWKSEHEPRVPTSSSTGLIRNLADFSSIQAWISSWLSVLN